MFRPVVVCTSLSTLARRGLLPACVTPVRSAQCESIRPILTSFMSPQSVTHSQRIQSAAYSAPETAARRGRRFSISPTVQERRRRRSLSKNDERAAIRSNRKEQYRGYSSESRSSLRADRSQARRWSVSVRRRGRALGDDKQQPPTHHASVLLCHSRSRSDKRGCCIRRGGELLQIHGWWQDFSYSAYAAWR